MADHAQTSTCINCGKSSEDKYCGGRGTAIHAHRITLGHIIHEVVHLFTHFDKDILYTAKHLLQRPGLYAKGLPG